MAQTFTNLLARYLFSAPKTAYQASAPNSNPDLHAYLGGITRNLQGQAFTVNGTADHVHLLVWLPPIVAIAEALRVLKSNSSRWVHDSPGRNSFPGRPVTGLSASATRTPLWS